MLVRLLRDYLRPYARSVLVIVVLQVVQTLAALSLPSLNADIIDDGVLTGDTTEILRLGGVMLAVTAVQVTAAIAGVYLSARTAMALGRDVRRDVFDRVQAFSAEEVGRFGAPSLITRSTNDVQQVQLLAVLAFTIMMMAPIMMVGGVVMALRQDVGLSGLLLVSVPVLLGVLLVGVLVMRPLFRTVQAKLDRINGILREQIAGVRVVRAFVRQDAERDRFLAANADLMDVSIKVGRVMALMFPAVQLVVGFSQVGVIWFGAGRIDSGQMEVGALVAFLNYLMQILMSVLMAVMMFMMVPRAEVSAERISEVLGAQPRVVRPPHPLPLPAAPRGGAGLRMELRHAAVRYPGADEPVLHDVDLVLEPGRTTAVVGSTGSGKTTLVNLLPRLLEVSSGAVLANDVDIRQLDPTELRARIALVPQRTYLFSGTVATTLRHGRPDATDEDLWAALDAAQASEFVRDLPDGLGAAVDAGGANFSGGQRQRLAIARALLRRADLYVFDDSFSALDLATEARLRAALPAVVGDAAVLVVGQRVSTIRDADQIVVLDAGRVVGVGTHAELMAGCATYTEIVLSQQSAEEAA